MRVPTSARRLDLRDAEQRAVGEHGRDDVEDQGVVVGRGRGQAAQRGVEAPAAGAVGLGELAEGVGGRPVEDLVAGTVASRRSRACTPVSAARPPGRNFAAYTQPGVADGDVEAPGDDAR